MLWRARALSFNRAAVVWAAAQLAVAANVRQPAAAGRRPAGVTALCSRRGALASACPARPAPPPPPPPPPPPRVVPSGCDPQGPHSGRVLQRLQQRAGEPGSRDMQAPVKLPADVQFGMRVDAELHGQRDGAAAGTSRQARCGRCFNVGPLSPSLLSPFPVCVCVRAGAHPDPGEERHHPGGRRALQAVVPAALRPGGGWRRGRGARCRRGVAAHAGVAQPLGQGQPSSAAASAGSHARRHPFLPVGRPTAHLPSACRRLSSLLRCRWARSAMVAPPPPLPPPLRARPPRRATT